MEEVIDDIELSETTVDDLLESKLVVFNDDDNSFEWVISCFCNYLKMGSQQAEQLALIIHSKGKATVKSGTVEDLTPFKVALSDAGLTVEIQ